MVKSLDNTECFLYLAARYLVQAIICDLESRFSSAVQSCSESGSLHLLWLDIGHFEGINNINFMHHRATKRSHVPDIPL
jgi:hypothetical protein